MESVELAELMLMSDIGEWFLSAPYFLNISCFQYKAAAGEQQCVVAACAETVSFLGWAGAHRCSLCSGVDTILISQSTWPAPVWSELWSRAVRPRHWAACHLRYLTPVSPTQLSQHHLQWRQSENMTLRCYIKAWESNPVWWGVISWCVPLSRGR